jgi:hypothetical protein
VQKQNAAQLEILALLFTLFVHLPFVVALFLESYHGMLFAQQTHKQFRFFR